MEDGCSAAAESHFLFLELEGSEKPLLNIIISHAEQQPLKDHESSHSIRVVLAVKIEDCCFIGRGQVVLG